jgi:lipid-A-disaccharide synthase
LSVGEASGDAYAAAFVRELRHLSAEPIEFEGVGGSLMREVGVRLIADSSSWGAMGVINAAKIYPRVASVYPTVLRALRTGKPGLVVPIDFGFFNIRICRAAKEAGWKVLYFVPPGCWRRDRQGRDLPSLTDAISTPFSWSADILNRMGAHAHWFGHPIRQLMAASAPAESQPRDSIAIMPGSRRHEVQEHLPLVARALRERPETLDFIAAPSIGVDRLKTVWNKLAPGRNDRFTTTDKYIALRRAKGAIVCSGTATLDAALSDCPMVVVYKTSLLNHVLALAMRLKGQTISLPNLLLEERILPELVGAFVSAQDVASALGDVLANPASQLQGFAKLKTLLGPEDAISKTAELGLSL